MLSNFQCCISLKHEFAIFIHNGMKESKMAQIFNPLRVAAVAIKY